MKRFLQSLVAVMALAGCSKNESPSASSDSAATEPSVACVAEALRAIRVLEGTDDAVRFVDLDVKEMTAETLKAKLVACGNPASAHLWMAGAQNWLIAEHAPAKKLALSEIIDRLAVESDTTLTIPEIFASYVGTLEEVLPAFDSNLEGEVVPEWFVAKKLPDIDWISLDDVDADILKPMLEEIGRFQVVRRMILQGNMLAAQAKDKASEEFAIEKWAEAYRRNPNDSLLNERCENLRRNGEGLLAVKQTFPALKCFETLVLIDSTNPDSLEAFGKCLLEIGRRDLGEHAILRAEELRR